MRTRGGKWRHQLRAMVLIRKCLHNKEIVNMFHELSPQRNESPNNTIHFACHVNRRSSSLSDDSPVPKGIRPKAARVRLDSSRGYSFQVMIMICWHDSKCPKRSLVSTSVSLMLWLPVLKQSSGNPPQTNSVGSNGFNSGGVATPPLNLGHGLVIIPIIL